MNYNQYCENCKQLSLVLLFPQRPATHAYLMTSSVD